MVTAYDAPSARIVDDAGVDMILVGDSVAMVVLGYDDTLQVTIDDMAHHVGAVARTQPAALVVGDLPWLSYHVSTRRHRPQRGPPRPRRRRRGEARGRAQAARRGAGDPRRRDPGDGPPRPHPAVGPRLRRVQGPGQASSRPPGPSSTTPIALAEAGCFAIVLECVPDAVARLVTDTRRRSRRSASAPGRHCDGQVLVFHDLLGLEERITPKFVRRYAELGTDARAALSAFADDVRAGRFPSSDETYHAADTVADEIALYGRTA